jgi:murein L,D-transpeptidase YcbB/YkuD
VSFIRPLVLALSLTMTGAAAHAQGAPGSLQQRIEDESAPLRVADRKDLKAFYAKRGFRPAWDSDGRGDKLMQEIQSLAAAEGLSPSFYAMPAGADKVAADILVSDILARFGRDLASGRVQPARNVGGMGPESRPAFDASAFLARLAEGRPLSRELDNLPPPYAGYLRLKAALDRYKAIAAQNGWKTIPSGPSIKSGMQDDRVALVRSHLAMTGDLTGPDATAVGTVLDKTMMDGLKRFQTRHGIEPDGFVGPQTLAALNVPMTERVKQIQANLERWRWMPRRLDSSHIAVNIPAAHLELVRDGHIDLSMRVVVGDIKHQTPPMVTTLTSVVLNPTWTVPPSIATKEILPKLHKDPTYLAANNMVILDAFQDDPEKAQGIGIDWHKYRKLQWRLRQKPGADNALGQVKFVLSNSEDIYLHDTPKRQYFGRIFRALSHGCVRLERPVELAKTLVGGDMAEKIPDLIVAGDTKTLRVEKALTVYLMYFTAWAEDDGTVHFREDLYGHDGRLKAALKRTQG